MTPEEILIAKNLGTVKTLPGSWAKKFITVMHYKAEHLAGIDLTDSQKEWLFRLLYTYRKQIPDIYKKFNWHPFCKPKRA